jgi:hypothetical protein
MIRPTVGRDLCEMAAFVVGTVNQEAANAGRSHSPEGDFHRRLAKIFVSNSKAGGFFCGFLSIDLTGLQFLAATVGPSP